MDENEEIEYEVEFTSAAEYIQSAYFALSCVEDMDIEILPSEAAKRRIKRIKFKSLRIIDHCLNQLYNELFEEDENTPE